MRPRALLSLIAFAVTALVLAPGVPAWAGAGPGGFGSEEPAGTPYKHQSNWEPTVATDPNHPDLVYQLITGINAHQCAAFNGKLNAYVVASHRFGDPGTFLPPQQINGDDDLWWYPSGIIAVSPDGKNAYAPSGKAISWYRISPATGALSARPVSTARTVPAPEAIALSPHGTIAYVTSEGEGALSQFASGTLFLSGSNTTTWRTPVLQVSTGSWSMPCAARRARMLSRPVTPSVIIAPHPLGPHVPIVDHDPRVLTRPATGAPRR